MIIKRFILFTVIFTIILVGCSSCQENQNAESILLDITNEIDDLALGSLYLKSANEGNAAYPSPKLLSSLYHEKALEYEFTLIEDFAIYLSLQKPCEIAVFKCYSASDTDIIAAMCIKRINTLSVLLEGTPYENIPKKAKVEINGRTVCVIML